MLVLLEAAERRDAGVSLFRFFTGWRFSVTFEGSGGSEAVGGILVCWRVDMLS